MCDDLIPEIPPVPPKIIEAINDRKLAVFIGAGVSRLVGCIGWDELARNLVNCCYGFKLIDLGERESLCESKDHKKTITICYNLLNTKGHEKLFLSK